MATVWPHPYVLSLSRKQKLPLLIDSIFQVWHQFRSLGPWASLQASASTAGPVPRTLMLHWNFCRKWLPQSLPTHRSRQHLCRGRDWSLSLSWPKGRGETSPEILLKWFKPLEAQPSESWQINCAHSPQWHLLQIISIQVGFVKVLRPCVLQSCLYFSFLFFSPTNIIKRRASSSWSHIGKLVHEQNSNNK